MRKIVIYLLLALGFSSCEKYLEVSPTNTLVVKSYEDVKALMGAHIRMWNEYDNALSGTSIPFKNEDLYLFFAFYSDDLNTDRFMENQMCSYNWEGIFIESLDWMNESVPGILWSEFFSNIGFYNTVIDGVHDVEATEEEKDIVRNEAKFLRAWYLFKLSQYFSPYKQNELGIPLNLESEKIGESDTRRRTQAEVYDIIIADLMAIVDSKATPRNNYNIFFDKKLAHALLAEVYLFKGGSGAGAKEDYTQAVVHAQAAIEGHELSPVQDYKPFTTFAGTGIFKDTKEALLSLVWYDYYYKGMYYIMNPYYTQYPSDAVYRLYTDDDVRKTKFFGQDRTVIKFDGALDSPYGTYQNLVFNYFHVAEMYLIVAEGYARSGDEGNARTWLENFQKCRYLNYNGYQGNDLLKDILEERRKEFFLEQDIRWCDLIREPKGWTRKSYKNEETASFTIKDDDYRFCLPIPVEQELQYNNIPQNPGWGMH